MNSPFKEDQKSITGITEEYVNLITQAGHPSRDLMFIVRLSTRDIREIGYGEVLDLRPDVSKEGTREYREGIPGIIERVVYR